MNDKDMTSDAVFPFFRRGRMLHCFLLLLTLFVAGGAFAQGKSDKPTPVHRKVYLLVQAPLVVDKGVTKPLPDLWPANDPKAMTSQLIDEIRVASKGYLNYSVVTTRFVDEFPMDMDGQRFAAPLYMICLAQNFKPLYCKKDNDLDYGALFVQYGLCDKIRSGEIDEVFLYGGPGFGYDEFAWKIPGDKMPYHTPTNEWIYEYRKKNLPDCGRSYTVMGFNYKMPIYKALHSYGHRIESNLVLTVGRGFWNQCETVNSFDRYTCPVRSIGGDGPVYTPGCGNIHNPPNSTADEDYGNLTAVEHACRTWSVYPASQDINAVEDCTAWGCTEHTFIRWWMAALPYRTGYTVDGNYRNWWAYVGDYDNAVAILPYAPDLSPVGIEWSVRPPALGQTTTFGSDIRNAGATASSAFEMTWVVLREGVEVHRTKRAHGSIPANTVDSSGAGSFAYTFVAPGRYRIVLTVDEASAVMETNKLNNGTSIGITVP